jgi:hypothetical protein
MYACYQDNIVAGDESFPLPRVIAENLFYLAMWVLSGYLLWPIWKPFGLPLLAIIWAILVVIIQVLLKKHNCSGCYYYGKMCHLGWGEISAAMFRQDSGNPKIGVKLAFFYILPPPLIFLTALAYAIIESPAGLYWPMLVLFVILNAASFPMRKNGCGVCAMREACPGSAVKSKRTA